MSGLTTLGADASSGATSFTTATAIDAGSPLMVLIEDEVCVATPNGTTTLAVERAAQATLAASHTSGVPIYEVTKVYHPGGDIEVYYLNDGNLRIKSIAFPTDPPSGGGGLMPDHAGDPTGVVTPTGTGFFIRDTTTNTIYIATGPTSADWLAFQPRDSAYVSPAPNTGYSYPANPVFILFNGQGQYFYPAYLGPVPSIGTARFTIVYDRVTPNVPMSFVINGAHLTYTVGTGGDGLPDPSISSADVVAAYSAATVGSGWFIGTSVTGVDPLDDNQMSNTVGDYTGPWHSLHTIEKITTTGVDLGASYGADAETIQLTHWNADTETIFNNGVEYVDHLGNWLGEIYSSMNYDETDGSVTGNSFGTPLAGTNPSNGEAWAEFGGLYVDSGVIVLSPAQYQRSMIGTFTPSRVDFTQDFLHYAGSGAVTPALAANIATGSYDSGFRVDYIGNVYAPGFFDLAGNAIGGGGGSGLPTGWTQSSNPADVAGYGGSLEFTNILMDVNGFLGQTDNGGFVSLQPAYGLIVQRELDGDNTVLIRTPGFIDLTTYLYDALRIENQQIVPAYAATGFGANADLIFTFRAPTVNALGDSNIVEYLNNGPSLPLVVTDADAAHTTVQLATDVDGNILSTASDVLSAINVFSANVVATLGQTSDGTDVIPSAGSWSLSGGVVNRPAIFKVGPTGAVTIAPTGLSDGLRISGPSGSSAALLKVEPSGLIQPLFEVDQSQVFVYGTFNVGDPTTAAVFHALTPEQLGFFGASPTSQAGTPSTVQDIADALAAYGLLASAGTVASALPSWFQDGAGAPTGLTPSQQGAIYQDHSAGTLYEAIGTTSADWVLVGGEFDLTFPGWGVNSGYARGLGPAGGGVILTDVAASAGTFNRLVWSAGASDGEQTLQIQLGASGEFNHTWTEAGEYLHSGSVSIAPPTAIQTALYINGANVTLHHLRIDGVDDDSTQQTIYSTSLAGSGATHQFRGLSNADHILQAASFAGLTPLILTGLGELQLRSVDGATNSLWVKYSDGVDALSVGSGQHGTSIGLRTEDSFTIELAGVGTKFGLLNNSGVPNISFFGAAFVPQQTSTGLASLLTAFKNYGLLDSGASLALTSGDIPNISSTYAALTPSGTIGFLIPADHNFSVSNVGGSLFAIEDHSGVGRLGFFGATAVIEQAPSNFAGLVTALKNYGLITGGSLSALAAADIPDISATYMKLAAPGNIVIPNNSQFRIQTPVSVEVAQFQNLAGVPKLSFFGNGPVIQQSGASATAGATYTGTEQVMINRMYTALRAYGLLG